MSKLKLADKNISLAVSKLLSAWFFLLNNITLHVVLYQRIALQKYANTSRYLLFFLRIFILYFFLFKNRKFLHTKYIFQKENVRVYNQQMYVSAGSVSNNA